MEACHLATRACPRPTRRTTSSARGAAPCSPGSASLLLRQPEDVGAVLPFDEVVDALGRVGERDVGLQSITLDTIVGSVDRTRDFDRLVPPHLRARAPSLGAHRAGDPARRGVPADRGLPRRRRPLRARRAPPGLRRARTRAGHDRRPRHRGPHAGRRRPLDPHRRPAAQEPRAAVLGARAAADRRARPHPPERPVALRRAGRGRGGLGLPDHAGRAPVPRARPGRAALVPRGAAACRSSCSRPPASSARARRRPTPTRG